MFCKKFPTASVYNNPTLISKLYTHYFKNLFVSFTVCSSSGTNNNNNKNMRNPLDLNNFPDDSSRDHGKQITLDDSSSSASGIFRKKKNGGKDESDKVYECRFCSLKFGKSQALGGHMNRHRQERETETLNRARQLVFSNDNVLPQLPPHQLGGQHGGFHHSAAGCNMGSTVYPTRLFSGTSSTTMLPPAAPPSSRLNNPYSSQYPINNDYFVGHVCTNNPPPFTLQNISTSTVPPPDSTNNYTCIGAPVGQSFTLAGGSGSGNNNWC